MTEPTNEALMQDWLKTATAEVIQEERRRTREIVEAVASEYRQRSLVFQGHGHERELALHSVSTVRRVRECLEADWKARG